MLLTGVGGPRGCVDGGQLVLRCLVLASGFCLPILCWPFTISFIIIVFYFVFAAWGLGFEFCVCVSLVGGMFFQSEWPFIIAVVTAWGYDKMLSCFVFECVCGTNACRPLNSTILRSIILP